MTAEHRVTTAASDADEAGIYMRRVSMAFMACGI